MGRLSVEVTVQKVQVLNGVEVKSQTWAFGKAFLVIYTKMTFDWLPKIGFCFNEETEMQIVPKEPVSKHVLVNFKFDVSSPPKIASFHA